MCQACMPGRESPAGTQYLNLTIHRSAARCREAFDLFDTDGSGAIDAKELKVAMRCALAVLTFTPPTVPANISNSQ